MFGHFPAQENDTIGSGLTEARISEIKTRCEQAKFGYTSIKYLEYYADVDALLRERDRLLHKLERLQEERDVLSATLAKFAP